MMPLPMRSDYALLDINPVFPGLKKIILIIIIMIIIGSPVMTYIAYYPSGIA